MPHRIFSPAEVARYLHLRDDDIQRLVKNHDIPVEQHSGRLIFRKIEIDAWASQRILGMADKRLVDYHRKTSRATREHLPEEGMMPGLIQPGWIAPALTSKTKASVLRDMVALADKTGRLYDPPELLKGLEARESLCSTGLPGGLAILHTRQPEAYLFESSFLILGRTIQQIPFGAPDGRPTNLFFLLACPDDRLHLHVLSRICLLVQKTDLLDRLNQEGVPEQLHSALLECESQVLQSCRLME
jgi:mannitol/fructose-specific phosphotransferase system IIA component (Ntr-type)